MIHNLLNRNFGFNFVANLYNKLTLLLNLIEGENLVLVLNTTLDQNVHSIYIIFSIVCTEYLHVLCSIGFVFLACLSF